MRLGLLLALIWPGLGWAETCRLALVIALDVSSSVDAAEDQLQRQGVAWALEHPDVVDVALAGRPVALSVFEWSGRSQQVVIVPWRLIENAEDLQEVARQVAGSSRSYDDYPTAMGYALGFAAGLFEGAPDCDQRTIDVAGDGINNEGFPPQLAYRHFPLDGVTVNGLVVLGDTPGLTDYFRFAVLRGPGAFLEVANGFEDYAEAMRRKLLRELAAIVIGSGPPPQGPTLR